MSNTVRNAYLTRRLVFSAGHRLNSKLLTPDENLKFYGNCNWAGGHGHNYEVEVTIYGPIHETTGMVLRIDDVKNYMNLAITQQLNHKNLDIDVPYFQTRPSTTENVAVFIWISLQKIMENPNLLHEVKVRSTENVSVSFKGFSD